MYIGDYFILKGNNEIRQIINICSNKKVVLCSNEDVRYAHLWNFNNTNFLNYQQYIKIG